MKSLIAILTFSLLPLLAGCGSPPSRGQQTAATPAEIPADEKTTGETLLPIDAALQQRQTPPEGVEAELSLFGGGVGGKSICSEPANPSRPTTAVFSSPTIMMGDGVRICADGVFPDQPVALSVTPPGGNPEQFQIDGFIGIYWEALPDKPYGLYSVQIKQGEREASDAFLVTPSNAPRIIITPFSAPPGDTFTVYLTGFRPTSTVTAHVYTNVCSTENPPDCSSYLTSLPPITVDGQGNAVYELKTSAGTRAGYYAIIHDELPPADQLWGYSFRIDQ